MHPAVLLRVSCLNFIVGVFVGSLLLDSSLSMPILVTALLLTVAFLLISSRSYRYYVLIFSAAIAGFLYVNLWHHVVTAVPLTSELKLDIIGHVVFVEKYVDKQRLSVKIQKPLDVASQKIFVYTSRYPHSHVGDTIAFSCSLKRIRAFEGFAFDKYAEERGINFMCLYPKIELLESGSGFRAAFFRIKDWYSLRITKSFHEPVSSLITAMLLNEASEIQASVRDSFSKSGLVHIISISGLHVSIVIVFLGEMLLVLGLSPKTRLVTAVIGMVAYLTLLGFPPAAVRASIMGSAFILGHVLGRPAQGLHTLVVTACFLIITSPLLLVYNIGFQFSFLAFLGIVTTYKFWHRIFYFIPHIGGLRSSIAITCAAQLFTWPLTLYYFDITSPISLVSNAILLPLSTFLLLGSFTVPLLSIVPVIGDIVTAPLYFLTLIFIQGAQVFSELPFAYFEITSFTIIPLCIAYGILGIITIWLYKKRILQ